ncbi:hypothetical protein D3P08_21705 [Paenibacillus nanensis]|uniref:Glutaredoxin n=1 Tax=Paenibacillus nanensis TaxID=393251 RepID=A0A3A1UQT9_9BACL|nr:hypothetical protein [Paenibacillus nanensis]RIX50166.1 hypothetical protein D3P08_21705 [Paenibacillus nanensis]
MGKQIEVFVDGSANGKELVKMVKENACPKCVVTIYDAGASGSDVLEKAASYGVLSIPAVTIDGKPIDHRKLRSGKIVSASRKHQERQA